MNKTALIEAINAFADAKMTNNAALVQMAGRHLGNLLDILPDELPSKLCEAAPLADESQP